MNVFHRDVKEKTKEVKMFVRQRYAWPGGYPMILVMRDGEALCYCCARDNVRQILRDTRRDSRSGWAAEGVDINYEGESFCANCSERLETAYDN